MNYFVTIVLLMFTFFVVLMLFINQRRRNFQQYLHSGDEGYFFTTTAEGRKIKQTCVVRRVYSDAVEVQCLSGEVKLIKRDQIYPFL